MFAMSLNDHFNDIFKEGLPMAQSPAQSSAVFAPDPRRWVALATLLLVGFMNLMDVTIVNVALPSLQRDLSATTSQIEWVVAGFVLAFALGLLPFGRLGDIIGKKTIFLVGVGLFTVMSVFCGLAPNIETLVAARILQGLAGAIMTPQVLSIIQNIFPSEERGFAFAMFGVVASLAAVTGPVLGGFLISLDLFGMDWRPIFLINLPIGIFAIVMGIQKIPESKGNPALSNDWIGIAIVTLASFFLIFPLIEGRTFGWPLWIFAMMVLSVPGMIAFVSWQKHQERNGRPQLLPMNLLRNKNYVLGTLATAGFFAGIPGFFMVVALLLQTGYGLTPFQSGATTIPFPIGIFIASAIAGKFGPRLLKPRLLVGISISLLGMFLAREAILGIVGSVDQRVFILPLFIAGIGMGTSMSVLFQLALADVPHTEAGSGSGGIQAVQQLGGAIGIAVIGQVFFSSITGSLDAVDVKFANAAALSMIFNLAILVGVATLALFLKSDTAASSASDAAPINLES
jgi:EmrB/QacA subfamily drug resistance transporter